MEKLIVGLLLILSVLSITGCNKQREVVESKPASVTYTGYITKITTDRILVASERKMTGSEMYDAMWLGVSDRSLAIGQRVKATLDGDIDSSYPGVGSASSVVVVPIPIVSEAKLRPEQALAQAIASKSELQVPIVTKIVYDASTEKWEIGLLDGLAPDPHEEIVIINEEKAGG
ncbi:DUF3221 domain-containing protein [Paenibacillus sp. CF384]|uniref:DUF3221 domain-containing protein n=1 Tax=Paenibacillus sp. CF384 TaxID=1884382 RepID=UPI00089D8ECE|nr:DUF3221 domain-containing protein [Paenibacillus sp. CF384]SDX06373.1 hypothetical protein SAMN05518855_1008120 [Paenibacillus sp. CF384]